MKGKEEMKKVFSGIIITLAAIVSGAMFLTAPAHAEDMVTAADNGPIAGIDSAQGAGVPTVILVSCVRLSIFYSTLLRLSR